MEDLTGRELGGYRVVGPLGEGGMAAVHRAYDPGLDRYVALKILPRHLASDPQFTGRFLQEAKLIAKLQHVHILPVYDYGQEDEYTFIVMPFVQTGTLADLLDDHPLALTDILRLVLQVGDALAYAHEQGVVHRDVKPSNILVDARGNCLLTDFGIAKIVQASAQFTQTGAVIGTPAYMSPEQILGEPLDGRSDLYSLGIVLFEMATGRQPYRAETPPAIFVKHLHDPLPMPRELNPNLPESVERVILKAMAKQAALRYQSASALASALEEAIRNAESQVAALPDAGPSSTLIEPPPSPHQYQAAPASFPAQPYAPSDAIPRRPWYRGKGAKLALLAATLTTVALVGAGVVLLRINRSPKPPPVTAQLPEAATVAPQPVQSPMSTPPATEAVGADLVDWRQGRITFVSNISGAYALYSQILDGDAQPQLMVQGVGNERFLGPWWSSAGDKLAYYIFGSVPIMWDIVAGTSVRSRTTCNSPTWNPVGTRIICGGLAGGRNLFYIIDSGTGAVISTYDPGLPGAVLPAWSPGGDEVAFSAGTDDSTSLWRASLGGGQPIMLAGEAGENYAPAWSPDGQQIAFQSNLGSTSSEVWVIGRTGLDMQRITNTDPSWSRAPSYSPDGEWIAFVSNREESAGADFGEVYLVSLATGELVRVTHTGGHVYDWRVTWTK